MSIIDLNMHTDMDHAIALAHLGARTAVLKALTNMRQEQARHIIRSVGGETPSGRIPTGAPMIIKRSQPHLQASLFSSIYAAMNDLDGELTARNLIHAYQTYTNLTQPHISKRVNCTEAWVIARDLHEKVVITKACQKCDSLVLRLHGYEYKCGKKCDCPFCAVEQKWYCARCGTKKNERGRCTACDKRRIKSREQRRRKNGGLSEHDVPAFFAGGLFG